MSRYKKWQPLEIRWEDSYHNHGWQPLDVADVENEDSLEQLTIGYFVGEGKRTISVCQSSKWNPELRKQEGTYVNGVMTIPKKAIVEVKVL